MAMSMALGILFMGGGSTTFSTRDDAVAALVIALYPRFPRATLDNRFHHQVTISYGGLASSPEAHAIVCCLQSLG